MDHATEVSAARMDLQCTGSILASAAYWMRVLAGIPQDAPIGFAQAILTQRADRGDKTAARKLAEFDEAATAYEGARTALATLIDERTAA
jgi:hypothetical protein